MMLPAVVTLAGRSLRYPVLYQLCVVLGDMRVSAGSDVADRATPDVTWVSLAEACQLLGVSPSTVRRWADSGIVRTFVTPGGHRRFSRQALESLLPGRPVGHVSLTALGETPERMAHGYRQAREAGLTRLPWVQGLDQRLRDRSRMLGRDILTSLIEALDSEDVARRAALLADAAAACAEYGRIAGREALGSAATAEFFLRFRRPFLDELGAMARRRDLDAASTFVLIADANAALDDLLVATLRGWEGAALWTARRREAGDSQAVEEPE
jgi:excisionase family DNA binding protein